VISVAVVKALAVFESTEPVKSAFTCTAIVIEALAPAGSVPSEQLTTPPLSEQLPWDAVTLTNVVCAGIGSSTTTFCASDGP